MAIPQTSRSERPALAPVPDACYLCKSTQLSLRFPARGGEPAGPDAYNCTSFGHRQHPPIWECEACGMLFQWPPRSASELVEAYEAVEDPLYVSEKESRYHTFRQVLKLLGPGRQRRLLDVGAYCGYFLDVAREGDFRPEGLELSRWAAGHARSLGFKVHAQTLAERATSGDRYDVVTLWDVVEHFADPRAELEAAFRLVKPGGRIYLSTIDAGSLVARLFGASWPWLMDMHLFYFNRATLALLLEEVGFRVLDKRAYTHVVSADYLWRKLGASFAPTAPLFKALRLVTPDRLKIPVNLGDNMVMVAERP
jgi:2-polyprenyl-3-methyl-5-hydroxy-6-metoxy-1,4-benzoquinol methylase